MRILLRRKEVVRRTALSASQIYRLMNDGEFPRQVQLSARSVAWIESEVEAWIDDRIDASGRKAA
jgi:prophage regulatory protein